MPLAAFKLVFLLVIAWSVMVTTHELGHLLGGWLGGGQMKDFDLAPWRLPYSLFEPNPHPRLTLWAGPWFGVLFPLAVASLVRHPAFWFIAHFCVLANGCYLAIGGYVGDRYLDTPMLIEAGASPVSLLLYCIVTIGFGYAGFRRSCIEVLSPCDSASTAR